MSKPRKGRVAWATGSDEESEPMTISGGPMEGEYRLYKKDLAQPEDRDHCGYADAEVDLSEFIAASARHPDIREHIDYEAVADVAIDLEEPPAAALARLRHELSLATQQRDFLSRQVDSLVQRLAASHVAQGLIDMAAAQGYVQKEILPINQVLAQIGAQPQPGEG